MAESPVAEDHLVMVLVAAHPGGVDLLGYVVLGEFVFGADFG